MEALLRTRSAGLTEALDDAVALMRAASAEALEVVAAVDQQERWRQDGATSMTAWLAARYGLGWGVAREWVRVARALRELPGIRRAYAEGRVAWEQLLPLTRFANAETDAFWSKRAPNLRPKTLWQEARRHEREGVLKEKDIHRRRSLSLTWDREEPILWLEGMLPAEQGAALERALSRRAERIVLADRPLSPGEARMADALVELAAAGGKGRPPAPTLVVHADAEMLTKKRSGDGKRPPAAETEEGCSFRPRPFAASPARPGWSGCSSATAGPWGWGARGGSPQGGSCGSFAAATAGPAASPGANGAAGSSPTTSATGATGGRRTSAT